MCLRNSARRRGGVQKPFLASSMDLLQQEGIVFPRFQLVQDVLVVLLPTLQHLCHANPLGRLLGEDSIQGRFHTGVRILLLAILQPARRGNQYQPMT